MKNYTKEELELMSYVDIAELILKDSSGQTTLELFKKICNLLELSSNAYENKIGDFYTALVTDKRFILLDNGGWDLKENHPLKHLRLDDDYEDLDDIESEEIVNDDGDDLEESEDKDIYDLNKDEEDENITDDYKDLVVVDEDEIDRTE